MTIGPPNNPSITTIAYVSNVEELSTMGITSTTTTSYYVGSKPTAQAVNGMFSYLGSDSVGSAAVALDGLLSQRPWFDTNVSRGQAGMRSGRSCVSSKRSGNAQNLQMIGN